MFSSVCALPSPTSAKARTSLFDWFSGTMAPSDFSGHVHVRRSVYGLRGPVLILRPRRAGDLPVLVHVVSQRAWVLRLPRIDQPLATNATVMLPSSTRNRVGILCHGLFEAQ